MSEHWERPPPEIGNIVVEIWCYLPEVYTLGEESEIQEILSKKCEKSQFSLEIWRFWSKNLEIFLKFFKIFLTFCPNAHGFAGGLLTFTCPMEIVPQILMILHFSTNSSRFSPNYSRIFMPFSIVLLYLSYFWAFLIGFSTRWIKFTGNFSGFIGYHKNWKF